MADPSDTPPVVEYFVALLLTVHHDSEDSGLGLIQSCLYKARYLILRSN